MVAKFVPHVRLIWMHQQTDSPGLNYFPGSQVNIKLSSNYAGTNGNPCTQTIIILHAETY